MCCISNCHEQEAEDSYAQKKVEAFKMVQKLVKAKKKSDSVASRSSLPVRAFFWQSIGGPALGSCHLLFLPPPRSINSPPGNAGCYNPIRIAKGNSAHSVVRSEEQRHCCRLQDEQSLGAHPGS